MTQPIDPTMADFGTECDHPAASYVDGHCRCIVCSRCGRHTGNATQGHYWSYCEVSKTRRDFHLCCPGDCELAAEEVAP